MALPTLWKWWSRTNIMWIKRCICLCWKSNPVICSLSVPATDITKPEIFPSLLFYYGMLTITATYGKRLVLSIPNNNVRKQYYEFLLEEYQDREHINLNDLADLFDEMAYDGHWRETLEFIAHAYKENSSVRSAIEGERNL